MSRSRWAQSERYHMEVLKCTNLVDGFTVVAQLLPEDKRRNTLVITPCSEDDATFMTALTYWWRHVMGCETADVNEMAKSFVESGNYYVTEETAEDKRFTDFILTLHVLQRKIWNNVSVVRVWNSVNQYWEQR